MKIMTKTASFARTDHSERERDFGGGCSCKLGTALRIVPRQRWQRQHHDGEEVKY